MRLGPDAVRDCAAAEPAFALGSQVGPYRIVGKLGAGGMGVVYRALHTQLDRPTAIKVLRPELDRSVWALDRFLSEARAAAAIRHPGIIDIYDHGIMPSGRPFIAMELLDGVTLGRRLTAGRLQPAEAVRLARQIADALAAAHARGVVHRDLKPDNIFLARDPASGALERVKLLDFGIASRGGIQLPGAPTDSVLGTPVYMSPEQCRGRDECDHRTDLYSLGCILFEMLSGQPPYGRGTTEALFAAHIRSPLPVLPAHAGVPPPLARLVARLLAKHPDARPRSARDVIAALDRWLAGKAPASVARAGALRLAVGAASELAAWFAALALWHRSWRALDASACDDIAESPELAHHHGGLQRARGMARGTGMNNAPTEPLPVAIDDELSASPRSPGPSATGGYRARH